MTNIIHVTEKVNELIDLHYRCENPIASQLDESVYINEKKIAIKHSLTTVNVFLDFMENPYSIQYGFWLNVKKELIILENNLKK